MLWYQCQDPQSEEVLDECSAVAEVRQWVEKYESILSTYVPVPVPLFYRVVAPVLYSAV